jgi:hypothetical protein
MKISSLKANRHKEGKTCKLMLAVRLSGTAAEIWSEGGLYLQKTTGLKGLWS